MIIVMFCISCSIRRSYTLPSLPSEPSNNLGKIAYSLNIIDHQPLSKEMYEKYDRLKIYERAKHHIMERDNRFITSIKQALQECGYNELVFFEGNSSVAQNIPKSKLIVSIEILPRNYDYGHAAAPQEWLTGLSFGLIPSWSIRHKFKINFEFFENEVLVKKWKYMTKELWVNHIILFPFSIFQIIVSDKTYPSPQISSAVKYFMRSKDIPLERVN